MDTSAYKGQLYLKDNMEQEKDKIQKDASNKGQNALVSSASHSHYEGNASRNNLALFKAEKIVIATYMVTNFISDSDPIKARIRGKSMDLLSDMHIFIKGSSGDKSRCYGQIITATGEIKSFLSVAVAVSLISSMNFSILKREYDSLVNMIESPEGGKEINIGQPLFDDGFFKIKENNQILSEKDDMSRIDPSASKYGDSKGQNYIKDKTDSKMSFINKQPYTKQNDSGEIKKDNFAYKPKNNRRENILKILAKKKEVTIRDISQSISDVSEKTIQRELLSLVRSGILKKEGEKRWSRYSLK